MKVTCHKRGKWKSQEVTVTRIDRETLSLILSFAGDGIRYELGRCAGGGPVPDYTRLLEKIKQIDEFINHEDGMVRLTPLEIPNYG